MSVDDREKYVESGTGQVFHVWLDEDSGKWIVGMFAGGPEPIQPIHPFESRAEAEARLTQPGCKRWEGPC